MCFFFSLSLRVCFCFSPAGTSFQVVMSLGCDWLRTGPTSDAQVSPVLQAMAPSRERHIQEAEYCLPKSMGISPGPTCNTAATYNHKLGGNKQRD